MTLAATYAPGRIPLPRLLAGLSLVVALLGSVTPNTVRAEGLVTALSAPEVSITSNFTGAEIVVFGVIERDAATVARPDPYDVVIVVTGPPADVVTRRKERLLGVWVNRNSMTFVDVPSFYALHTSRALSDIAEPEFLKQLQVGVDSLLLPAAAGPASQFSHSKAYRRAFIRLKLKSGLYTEQESSVQFLNKSLFRTTVPLPANVPNGTYNVKIHLFRGGVELAYQTQKLTIAKTGFEQFTYTLAQKQSFFYGLATVLMALFTGWLAGIVFRRD